MAEKKKKKFSFIRLILKSLLWLLLILIVAVLCIYYYLGAIVKEGVNRYVPPITGTTASVGSVDLSLLKGQIEIKDLKIGNPKGYSDNNIFEVGKVLVTFQPKTVLTDKIIINSVLISGTKVSAEMKNLYSLDSNVSDLQNNINKYLGAPAETKEPEKKDSAGKKVVIKDLKIKGSSISLGAHGKTITLPMPDIHQKGIGENKKGKSMAQIFADILNMISLESVKGLATAVKDLAKGGLETTKGLISDGAGAVTDKAKSVTDGIKGIFK
ncbi:MAG: AsmA family protein [Alphaproteobacteria bacterium]|nr:AsmA family protein [Alphaproteobacteria bacterium]